MGYFLTTSREEFKGTRLAAVVGKGRVREIFCYGVTETQVGLAWIYANYTPFL
jgi:hypothetical protein